MSALHRSIAVQDHPATDARRKTAEFARFPKSKFPPLPDYARACAALIAATFPASSRNGVCDRAERETGAAGADTFERIIAGKTKRPDGYLMQCVMAVAASRGVAIPPELAVRQ